MKTILLFSKYSRLGASSRMRTIKYIDFLEQNGYKVVQRSLFDDEYLTSYYHGKRKSKLILIKSYLKRMYQLPLLFKYDLIWIEKEIFPYLPPFIEFLLYKTNKKYIVDYDDAIFHNYDMSDNKVINFVLKKKIDYVMKWSSLVVCGNDYLKNRAILSGAKNIKLVPTVVEHTDYSNCKIDSDIVKIGWIGTPSTQKYLIDIKDELECICKEYNCELFIVGGSEELKTYFSNINISINKWSEKLEAQLISNIDIGIMPLPNEPFERGKCGYKLIQYMASGKAVIGSNVGVNNEIISTNKCGLLVDNVSDWTKNLKILLEDPNLRIEMGNRGRKAVEDIYSYDKTRKIILNEFDNIVNNKLYLI